MARLLTMRSPRLGVTSAALGFALSATVLGLTTQSERTAQQTFRGGVELVELDVIVLNRDRHPIRGLTKQDFTILENGHTRPIVGFAAVELPLRNPAGTVTPNAKPSGVVVTNNQREPGRLVVIVFDRSIPVGPPTEVAKAIARSAVNALGRDDYAAVVRTSGFANEGRSQNFTRDRTCSSAPLTAISRGW